MRSVPLLFVAFCASLSVSSVHAAERSLALLDVSGPKAGGARQLQAGLREALESEDYVLVSESRLRRVEKKHGKDLSPETAAHLSGADLLISASIQKARRRYIAKVELVDTKTGEVVYATRHRYKNARAAWSAGSVLGGRLSRRVERHREAQPVEAEEPVVAQRRVVPAPEAPRAVASQPLEHIPIKDEVEEEERRAKAPGKKKKSTTRVTEAAVELQKNEADSERKLLRIDLGTGSQLSRAYTVFAGDQPTRISYRLKPLAMISGGVGLSVPSSNFFVALGVRYVPVRYTVDVNPAVTPESPGGMFLDVEATVAYRFRLLDAPDSALSRFELAPLGGMAYRYASVENQEPVAILTTSGAFAPHAGLRGALGIGDSLTVDLDVLAHWLPSYAEGPVTTGQSGSGFGLTVGAVGRYWLWENLGAYASLGYDYFQVGFTGEGSRARFEEDPELLDAKVYTGGLRAGVGLVLAFSPDTL